MRIDHLRLKGLTCFADEVSIDFRTIPPGLVAIVGINGAGKTTLMESMVAGVYRQLPTRGKVGDYATGKDSFIDAGFTFDGLGSFRTRLSLDGVKGGGDAVLERVMPDGLGYRLNDGKVTTFDAAVKDVFPPLEALLASSFAAQNRAGSFAIRSKTERKDLFTLLLGLNQLDGFATTARAAAALLDKRLAELRGRRDGLLDSTSDEAHEQLQKQAYALTADLAAAEDAKTAIETDLARIDAELVTLRAEVETHTAAVAERGRLEAKRDELTRRRAFYDLQDADLETEHAHALKGTSGRLATTLGRLEGELASLVTDDALAQQEATQLATIDFDLAAYILEREARIANNTALKAQETEIRAAVAAIEEAGAAIGDLRRRLTDARAISWAEDIENATNTVRDADATIKHFAHHGRAANLLMDVPCGGEGTFATCQFLKDATESAGIIKALGRRNLQQERDAASTELERLRCEQREHAGSIIQMEGEIGEFELAIVKHRPLASQLMHLVAADDRIAERRKDIAAANTKADQDRARVTAATASAKETRAAARTRLTAAAGTARTEAAAEEQALIQKTADTRQRRSDDRTALEADLTTITAQLAGTGDVAAAHATATADVAAKDVARQDAARRLTEASASHARVDEQVLHLRLRQAAWTTARAQRDALDASIATLETDLLDWQVLAQVMGREGLAVLEIDAAGPGVSAHANDLLQASYSGRFLLELVTQEPKADGKGLKEVFELKVYDQERGGEVRDLADLSGGEQVIVDSALRMAIALWQNQRNERPIRTAWLDETTGALDPENALRYLAMLRRLHERAGLHHLFFVSHNSEVSALADVQLQIADGRVTVAYAPFAPAASSQEAA